MFIELEGSLNHWRSFQGKKNPNVFYSSFLGACCLTLLAQLLKAHQGDAQSLKHCSGNLPGASPALQP